MKSIVLISATLFILFGCKENISENALENGQDKSVSVDESSQKTIENVEVPEGFQFKTRKKVNFRIELIDNEGTPISGVRISVFLDQKTIIGKPTPSSKITIPTNLKAVGYTNNKGVYMETMMIPDGKRTLYIQSGLIGIDNIVEVQIESNEIIIILGPKE